MKHAATIVSAFLWVTLATCGVVESIQESDVTKMTLVMSLAISTAGYLVWKKRALQCSRLAIRLAAERMCCVCGARGDEECDSGLHGQSFPCFTGEAMEDLGKGEREDDGDDVSKAQNPKDDEKLHVN